MPKMSGRDGYGGTPLGASGRRLQTVGSMSAKLAAYATIAVESRIAASDAALDTKE
jgi:hypothetical protein